VARLEKGDRIQLMKYTLSLGIPFSCSYSFFSVDFPYHRSYLITHAHLDHINSLVISAGSLHGQRKSIYAMKQTLQDIEHVFADRLWPNLASWDDPDEDYKFLYKMCVFSLPCSLRAPKDRSLESDGNYHPIHPLISARSFPLNHGTYEGNLYISSAFFVRHDHSSVELLFFGDVEPDSLASVPRTIDVWRAAASRIPDKLRAIFIECSWPSGRPDEMLYGHLTPDHLVAELVALAKEVVNYRKRLGTSTAGGERPRKRQRSGTVNEEEDLKHVLDGLSIYIMHCKDDMLENDDASTTRHLIKDQVEKLLGTHQLGVQIECVEPGMRISKLYLFVRLPLLTHNSTGI
jgi:cAMP phosphodiesterase